MLGRPSINSIVGRTSELGRITSFLDDDAPGQLALWLAGAAGVGKTTLWRAGTELGQERGYRVLTCQPTAAERDLSFAALGDLLSTVMAEVLPGLPTPQRRAIETALALESNAGAPLDARVLGLTLGSALRLVAVGCPVLMAVDDVQWLDPPSAAVLSFAARRIGDERVKLLISERTDESTRPVELRTDLSGRCEEIDVGPVSIGALHRMVVSCFGQSLTRPTLRRIYDASAGNPLYALEIARILVGGRVTLSATEPLPIPHTLEEILRSRLASLPGTVQRVLEAAALLAEPTVSALTDMGSTSAAVRSRLERAVAAGVIRLEGDRVRFTHPLLAAAVVAGLEPRRRMQLHVQLSAVAVNLEERARHLALGCDGADATVAESLEQAAQEATIRGAPEAAAELAELAAQRTPLTEPEARWRRSILAGLRHASAGDRGRARALLEPLADEIPPGEVRSDVFLNLADFHWDNITEASALARRALAEAGDDPVRLARIHLLLAELTLDSEEGLRHSRAALEAAEQSHDDHLITQAIVNLVRVEVSFARMTPGLLERAFQRAGPDSPPAPIAQFESPQTLLGIALHNLTRFDQAHALLSRGREDSLEQGVPVAAAVADVFLAEVECRLGYWRAAETHAAECAELYEQLGLPEHDEPLYASALVHAHLGNVDEARKALERVAAAAARSDNDFWILHASRASAVLELSLGRPAAAVACLHPLVRRLTDAGWRWTDAWDALPITVEALVSAGELEPAAEVLELLETRNWLIDSPWRRALIDRCRGLLASAQGDHEAALAALTSAMEHHRRVQTPFEQARTLLALGALQRRMRHRRAARSSLETSLTTFEHLGARLWADNARAELRRIGGRSPAGDALTRTERQVAELVAGGMSNSAAAARLSVTVKAIEANLTRIYAKLGVHSRTELAVLMAKDRTGGHSSAQ